MVKASAFITSESSPIGSILSHYQYISRSRQVRYFCSASYVILLSESGACLMCCHVLFCLSCLICSLTRNLDRPFTRVQCSYREDWKRRNYSILTNAVNFIHLSTMSDLTQSVPPCSTSNMLCYSALFDSVDTEVHVINSHLTLRLTWTGHWRGLAMIPPFHTQSFCPLTATMSQSRTRVAATLEISTLARCCPGHDP